jgi:sugar lactone lactonase YvrE
MGKVFRCIVFWSGICLLLVGSACSRLSLSGPPRWRAERIVTIGDLNAPVCALPCGERGLFISNSGMQVQGGGANDAKGSIGLYALDGMALKPHWLDNTPAAPIHAPRGLAVLNGFLYFSEKTRLMRCPLDRKGPVEEVTLPAKGVNLNDVAADGSAVYVSEAGGEGAAPLVYRCEPAGVSRTILAPDGVKGITVVGPTVYAVSGEQHEIYELSVNGAGEPKALGLAGHFQNPTGIVALRDGTLLVTDTAAGRVCAVTPDRATVYPVVELKGPADPGLFESPDLLYVPQTELNQVSLFRLVLK